HAWKNGEEQERGQGARFQVSSFLLQCYLSLPPALSHAYQQLLNPPFPPASVHRPKDDQKEERPGKQENALKRAKARAVSRKERAPKVPTKEELDKCIATFEKHREEYRANEEYFAKMCGQNYWEKQRRRKVKEKARSAKPVINIFS
ncbi:unnamed protein product, partial [Chrysoparadoxa australica]